MGFPPPPDLPPPEVQDSATVSASFEPSPSGPSLCGFGIPTFSLTLTLPSFQFPPFPFPPTFNFFLGLNCDLSNPISADFSFGGGRVPNVDPESDPELEDS